MTKIKVKGREGYRDGMCCDSGATVSWKLMVHTQNHMKRKRARLAHALVHVLLALWSSTCPKATANANWHLRLLKERGRREQEEEQQEVEVQEQAQEQAEAEKQEEEQAATGGMECEPTQLTLSLSISAHFLSCLAIYNYLLLLLVLHPLKLVYDIFTIILEIPLLLRSTLGNKLFLLLSQTSSLLRLILWILILSKISPPLPPTILMHNYVKHAKLIHKSFWQPPREQSLKQVDGGWISESEV